MWSYLIKGFFPKFGTPQVRCKIDARWNTGQRFKLKSLRRKPRRNILLANI